MKEHIEKFNQLKSDRSTWDAHFQVLGEYVSQVQQNFQSTHQPGEFLNADIFDSTGTYAAHNAASALLGMLWPGSAKQSIEIVPPDDLEMTGELAEFYEGKMTNRTIRAMDDPKANLALALDEYMLDQMIFATSGVGVEKGYESKLLYKPYGVKELYINEGRNGKVNEANLFFEWSVQRVIDEYGEDNVSEKVREKYRNGKTSEKIKILNVIAPRSHFRAKKGKLSMLYMSLHIEYDAQKLLREDGFDEFPIPVGRLRKLNYEMYGRSFAMAALPDIREANALREAIIIATEKALDMPKGVYNDGMLGGGFIDTSANAINVFNAMGNIGSGPPIFDIGTPPDVRIAEARLEKLEQNISQHFHIDRLLDFNNKTAMTFGEAKIRDQIRMASLSALFSRQISEVLTPLIERSVALLFRMGEFGYVRGSEEEQEALARGERVDYIPDAIAERLERGESVYEISYKTQAAQAARSEEYIAILDVVNFAAQGMEADPSLRYRVDLHAATKQIGAIRGVPVGILRENDEVDEMMQQEAAQQAQAQELAAAEQISNVAGNLAGVMAQ